MDSIVGFKIIPQRTYWSDHSMREMHYVNVLKAGKWSERYGGMGMEIQIFDMAGLNHAMAWRTTNVWKPEIRARVFPVVRLVFRPAHKWTAY